MSEPSLRGRPAEPVRTGGSTAYSHLYQQIKALVVRSLDQGEWKPGEAIPSELELAARFQVSQGTVRKAIDELAAENLLLRRQGKGTFVATHQERRVRFRFLRLASDDGAQAVPVSRVLECRRLRSPAGLAGLLHLRSGDMVINLRRLLSFSGAPTILDDIWLPAAAFKGLTAESLAHGREPLYAHFETRYGVSMVRADEKIKAVAATSEHAGLLEVEVGTPLLLAERLAYTYGDRPMEVRRGLYLTDHFHYRNSLN